MTRITVRTTKIAITRRISLVTLIGESLVPRNLPEILRPVRMGKERPVRMGQERIFARSAQEG